MSRIGRVLDASGPSIESKSINPPRRSRRPRPYGPEKQLLLEVNKHHGPLTSIDRMTLVSMGELPWDDGHANKECDEAHAGVDHLTFMTARHQESITDRLLRQHQDNIGRFTSLVPGITEPQEKLIKRLLTELEDIDPKTHATAYDWYRDQRAAGKMTKKLATETIKRLKHHCGYEEDGWKKRPDFRIEGRPDREAEIPISQAPDPIDYFDDVPDAYYAIRDEDQPEDGDHIKFFRVSTWKRPWKDEVRPGRKVEVVIGGNREAPMSRAAARIVLREIRAAGPEKSARLFGQKIGRCGRCGLTLTDEHSRAVGIGPTCEGKGW